MARLRTGSTHSTTNPLIAVVVVVATLYFAKDVLIPLALSVLSAFLLTPLAGRLDAGRFGRIVSVLVVTTIAVDEAVAR